MIDGEYNLFLFVGDILKNAVTLFIGYTYLMLIFIINVIKYHNN